MNSWRHRCLPRSAGVTSERWRQQGVARKVSVFRRSSRPAIPLICRYPVVPADQPFHSSVGIPTSFDSKTAMPSCRNTALPPSRNTALPPSRLTAIPLYRHAVSLVCRQCVTCLLLQPAVMPSVRHGVFGLRACRYAVMRGMRRECGGIPTDVPMWSGGSSSGIPSPQAHYRITNPRTPLQ